jgi:hypothetical protein
MTVTANQAALSAVLRWPLAPPPGTPVRDAPGGSRWATVDTVRALLVRDATKEGKMNSLIGLSVITLVGVALGASISTPRSARPRARSPPRHPGTSLVMATLLVR